MKRINVAIGNIKLEKLWPQPLNAFYENSGEPRIREGADKAIAKTDLKALLNKECFTRQAVATAAHIPPMTVTVTTQSKFIIGTDFFSVIQLVETISTS